MRNFTCDRPLNCVAIRPSFLGTTPGLANHGARIDADADIFAMLCVANAPNAPANAPTNASLGNRDFAAWVRHGNVEKRAFVFLD